jgi:zinc transporter
MTGSKRRFDIALLLDGKGGARELSDAEVDNWSPDDGLLWLDIDQDNSGGRKWLTKHPRSSILLAAETRPRSLVDSDGLMVVLRGINMNPGAVPDDMVATRMSFDNNRIVTARRRRVLSINDMRDELLAGSGPKTAGQFLVMLTRYLSGRIESAVENIEQMIESLDDRISLGTVEDVRVDLGIVRRQAAAIRRHLAPQRDALDRIARTHAGVLSDNEVFDLREEGDHLTRQIEDLDLARENALVTQEELMNRVALEQNSRMYLLSVVAAIFLPLTFVTGLLGMNVAGLPGTVNPNGFIYSALIMVGCLGALIAYFRFRKWL